MRAYERLLKYVVIPTASDDNNTTVPSTKEQFNLAAVLVDELKELGLSDARVDDKCYVYATLPATEGCEKAPAIGWISHMDTVSDFADHKVNPQIHEKYDGKDLKLGDSGRKLEVKLFPHLPNLKGRTLITSDGTTILGSDDKSGIAEIMTMLEHIRKENIAHGKLCIGFTPDEEVGAGADYFDVKSFGAEYAYTVDGGVEGGIEYENFNGASAKLDIVGVNVHPGDAKDIMVNAASVACEIQSLLPMEETPEMTEGYEGFFHLLKLSGDVANAHMEYIIRDHDREKFEEKKELLARVSDQMNEKYGKGTVSLKLKDQYYNMKEKIEPCLHLIENAKKAAKEAGIEPKVEAIRGGTDGARLSFMGLPCPNLGTGGYAFHGPFEHITVEGMDIVVEILVQIVKIYSKQS